MRRVFLWERFLTAIDFEEALFAVRDRSHKDPSQQWPKSKKTDVHLCHACKDASTHDPLAR